MAFLFFDEPPFTELEGFESMQQALFSDLESVLPGYFSESSSSISVKEKFDSLAGKIQKRWDLWLDPGAEIEEGA